MMTASVRVVRVRKHQFPQHILDRVATLSEPDNLHGPLELLEHWLIIAAAITVSWWSWNNLPEWLAFTVYLLAVFFIGGRQRSLADILHQSAHLVLARHRGLNHVLGTYLSGYLIFQSLSGYKETHVRLHHGHFADSKEDPDYAFYRSCNICGDQLEHASIKRYMLRMFTPAAIWSYLRYLVVNRIAPKVELPAERYWRLTYLLIMFGGLALWVGPLPVLAYWIVPFITTQAWIGAFVELFEHYPMIERSDRTDIHMSRNRHCSGLSNLLLGIKSYEGYHIIHHRFPALPVWRNHEAHRILMEDSVYATGCQSYGWGRILREVLHPRPNWLAGRDATPRQASAAAAEE